MKDLKTLGLGIEEDEEFNYDDSEYYIDDYNQDDYFAEYQPTEEELAEIAAKEEQARKEEELAEQQALAEEESSPEENKSIIGKFKSFKKSIEDKGNDKIFKAENKIDNVKDKVKFLKTTGGFLGRLLLNPITIGVVIAWFVLGIILSTTKVVGSTDFNSRCLPSGASNIYLQENADDITRQSAIASWLTSTPFEVLGGPMTKEQAAGVMGNFIIESYAKPTTVQTLSINNPDYYKEVDNEAVLAWGNVSGKAVGLAQWDSGRRVSLVNFAKTMGKQWHDLNVQLQFLKLELDTTEGANLVKGGFNAKVHTPGEYARLWNKLFERSHGDDNSPHVQLRKDAAQKFFKEYRGGQGLTANCLGGAIDTSNVVALAIQTSYPLGDKRARQRCFGAEQGSCGQDFSKPEYIEAKIQAQLATSNDPAELLLASCDRFVATMMRATGADPDYPWGAVQHQGDYMKSSPKWQQVGCQDRQPGDVILEEGKHIMLYVGIVNGTEVLASASHMERTASLMPVSCNGDFFNADSYTTATGWRLVQGD